MSRFQSKNEPRDLPAAFRSGLKSLAGALEGKKLVVAFSGGPDSTALIHLGREAAEICGFSLFAGHLDHGLRGEASERDRVFAEAQARRWGIPFYWEKTDCRRFAAERSLSIEEAAREARYAFFSRTLAHFGADYVLTGHTADDNAESVLINLIRGAGPLGLSGIPPRRDEFLRPLLGIWREELLTFLKTHRFPFVEDETNRSMDFLRNRVRHELLPLLRDNYNPAIKLALTRTAGIVREENAVWDRLTADACAKTGWGRSDTGVSLEQAAFLAIEPAIARRVVRQAVARARGTVRGLGLDHVESVCALARSGGAMDLPGGLRFQVDGGKLLFGFPKGRYAPDYEYALRLPGKTALPEAGWTITAEMVSRSSQFDPRGLPSHMAALDADRLSGRLVVRNPRQGDRFRPFGMAGTKKLSNFFIDMKIPADRRPLTPIVSDEQGIVWVGGLRPAETVRLTPETERVLLLRLEPV